MSNATRTAFDFFDIYNPNVALTDVGNELAKRRKRDDSEPSEEEEEMSHVEELSIKKSKDNF